MSAVPSAVLAPHPHPLSLPCHRPHNIKRATALLLAAALAASLVHATSGIECHTGSATWAAGDAVPTFNLTATATNNVSLACARWTHEAFDGTNGTVRMGVVARMPCHALPYMVCIMPCPNALGAAPRRPPLFRAPVRRPARWFRGGTASSNMLRKSPLGPVPIPGRHGWGRSGLTPRFRL
jgi:hypothetical protein